MVEIGKYKHYKGKMYQVLGVAKNSETLESMVVYKALYGNNDLWVRPESMWNEIIIVEGKKVLRFTKVKE